MVHLVAAVIVQAVHQEEVEAVPVLEGFHAAEAAGHLEAAAEAVAAVHLEDNY